MMRVVAGATPSARRLRRGLGRAAPMGGAATMAITLGAVRAQAQVYDHEYHGTVAGEQEITGDESAHVASDAHLTGRDGEWTMSFLGGGALVDGLISPTQNLVGDGPMTCPVHARPAALRLRAIVRSADTG